MYPGAGCSNPRSIRYRLVPGSKNFPAHRNQQIGTQQPDRHQAKQDSENEWDRPSKVHVFAARLNARSVTANSREEKEFEEFKEFKEEEKRHIWAWRRVEIAQRPPFSLNSSNSLDSFFLLCYLLSTWELLATYGMKTGSRIRLIGYLLGFAGATLLTVLILREGAARVAAALAAASWAVPVVVAINIPRMFSDGAAWLALVPRSDQPRFLKAVWIRWVGGSINDFFPSARLGGDILTARLATIRGGLPLTLAAGVAIVNMTVSVAMRILVTIATLLLIAGVTGLANLYVPTFVAGLTALIAVIGFYLVQRFGFFRLTTGAVSRVKILSKWSVVIQSGANFDDTVRRLYSRFPALLVCALFWITSWLIGCVETWVTLFALGVQTSFIVALIVETAGQSVRSVFFIVPAGLGIFEGGMVMICSLLGISGEVALALSLIRRAREALFSGPGLIIWQFVEARRVLHRANEVAS